MHCITDIVVVFQLLIKNPFGHLDSVMGASQSVQQVHSSRFYLCNPESQIKMPQWALQSVRSIHPLILDPRFKQGKATKRKPFRERGRAKEERSLFHNRKTCNSCHNIRFTLLFSLLAC